MFALRVMEVEPGRDAEETALRGIEAMEAFYREIGMPTNLHELGIDPTGEQLRELAEKCSIASGGKKGSAKVLQEADMLAIYQASLG